jgi:hypothetical protein
MTGPGNQPATGGEQPLPGEGDGSLGLRARSPLASLGYRAIGLIDAVKRMSWLLQGNVGQYRELVAMLQDPAVSLPILDLRAPRAHDDLLNEAERLLHNVLTAMSTRVDQQRRFIGKFFADDPDLTKDYLDRVAAFTASPEAVFMKGLRNYMTHMQLPAAQSQQEYTATSLRITFVLPSAPLLEWDGWNADTRAWIAGQGAGVAIVDVVDIYAQLADGLDRWLADRIALKYQAEIDAFRRGQQDSAPERSPAPGL